MLINRIRKSTENAISDEQGRFRRGRGCVDPFFAVRQVSEKCFEKGKDFFFFFWGEVTLWT